MLASGSFALGEAVDLTALVGHRRAGQALVSFVVSFSYVRNRWLRTTKDRQPKSKTLMTCAGLRPTDLESVLGAMRRTGREHRRGGRQFETGESSAAPKCSNQTDLRLTLADLFHGSDLPERPSPTSMRLVCIQVVKSKPPCAE